MTMTALSDGVVDVQPDIAGRMQANEVRRVLTSRGLPTVQKISVNVFALQDSGRITLIDTGAGNKLGPTLGRLGESLAAAVIDPHDVSAVLLTHMHPDHSNGLTDATGNAIYPNAELVMHEDELAHWLDDSRMAQVSPRLRRDNFEAARREILPYRDRIRLFRDGDVVPGVQALPLPGHTPGHTGYIVGSGNESVLVWGDIVHLPDVQLARPDIAVVLDTDRVAAIATRKRILDVAASDRLIVTGMHLHFPGFARVMREGGGFAFAAVQTGL
jgi:glyoxylase-like metal-dependent hydrolase (beta-lactamase superfamily II)